MLCVSPIITLNLDMYLSFSIVNNRFRRPLFTKIIIISNLDYVESPNRPQFFHVVFRWDPSKAQKSVSSSSRTEDSGHPWLALVMYSSCRFWWSKISPIFTCRLEISVGLRILQDHSANIESKYSISFKLDLSSNPSCTSLYILVTLYWVWTLKPQALLLAEDF